MTSDTRAVPVARGSAILIWTLLARAIGLAAGVALALLLVVALLSTL